VGPLLWLTSQPADVGVWFLPLGCRIFPYSQLKNKNPFKLNCSACRRRTGGVGFCFQSWPFVMATKKKALIKRTQDTRSSTILTHKHQFTNGFIYQGPILFYNLFDKPMSSEIKRPREGQGMAWCRWKVGAPKKLYAIINFYWHDHWLRLCRF